MAVVFPQLNFFFFSIFRSALSRLGVDSRTCGIWSHDVMNFVAQMVPRSILIDAVYNQMKTTKARALKKKLQAEKQK